MLSLLQLSQFRCFPALRCEWSPGCSALVGSNAEGKTTILEAVCVLLRLQSPRTARLADLAQHGQTDWSVSGVWNGRSLQVRFQGGRRRFFVEGNPRPRGRDYLAESGRLVWMGSEDRLLIRGPAGRRRTYLDFVASQVFPGYRATLLRYERAVRARNALLRREGSPDWAAIGAYDPLLARHGDELTRLRLATVGLLRPWVTEAHRTVAGGGETLELHYLPGAADRPVAVVLADSRTRDAARRQTTAGPHRDDLEICLDGRPAAAFASEGQQRTLAVALKLAQVGLLREQAGVPPLLLVDDVFGELDRDRRRRLLACLPPDTQVLLTTTDLGWLPDHREIRPRVYRVAGRTVEPWSA